jgi:nitrous oxidase accessory protein NosD
MRKKRKIALGFFLILIVFLMSSLPFQSSEASDTVRILIIGNSFVIGDAARLMNMTDPTGDLFASEVTHGGYALQGHYNTQMEAILAALESGSFDYAVIQESATIIYTDPDQFIEYATKFDILFKSYGVQTVLFQPWAYTLGGAEMAAVIWDRVNALGEQLNAPIAPVGLAFEQSRIETPDFQLIKDDGVHPTPLGRYLSNSVVYATVTENDPASLSNLYHDPDVAANFKSLAWKIVQSLYDIPPPTGQTFSDVPPGHAYFDEIEVLYTAGFTAGCATDPLRYCPAEPMNRAESAVFIERGIHSSEFIPSNPEAQRFDDLALNSWAAKWAEMLYVDEYSAGCSANPLNFCPWRANTRLEGAVFYMRMLKGSGYLPQGADGFFDDLPTEHWGAKWAEEAYLSGLIPACAEHPLQFCPDDPLDRGLAAYMMVQAKELLGPPITPTPPPPTTTPTPSPTATLQPGDAIIVSAGESIQAAVNQAGPGDTILVRSGSYHEQIIVTNSGTAAQPIKIAAYPGEHPVIDGEYSLPPKNGEWADCNENVSPVKCFVWGHLVSLRGDHIIFEGFEVKRSLGRGIAVWRKDDRPSDVIIRNNQVHDSRNAGIILIEVDNSLVEGNHVWHSGDVNVDLEGNYNSELNWPGAVTTNLAKDIVIRNNTIFENWSEGIMSDGHQGALDTLVEGNVLYDNMKLAVYIHRAEGMIVRQNLIYCTGNPQFYRGGNIPQGIVLANEVNFDDRPGALITKHVQIVNNVVTGCRHGIALWNSGPNNLIEDVWIAHNTLVGMTSVQSGEIPTAFSFGGKNNKDILIENNLILQTDGDLGRFESTVGVTFSHNLWSRPPADNLSGDGDLVGDPLLSDPNQALVAGQAQADWFSLSVQSPAIDAASSTMTVDFLGRLRDDSPDVGALEYSN